MRLPTTKTGVRVFRTVCRKLDRLCRLGREWSSGPPWPAVCAGSWLRHHATPELPREGASDDAFEQETPDGTPLAEGGGGPLRAARKAIWPGDLGRAARSELASAMTSHGSCWSGCSEAVAPRTGIAQHADGGASL